MTPVHNPRIFCVVRNGPIETRTWEIQCPWDQTTFVFTDCGYCLHNEGDSSWLDDKYFEALDVMLATRYALNLWSDPRATPLNQVW